MPENVVYTIEMRGKDSGGVSVMEHITQAIAKAGAELNRLIAAAGGLDKAVKMSVTQPVVDDKDNQIGSVRASAQDDSASVDRAKVNSLQIIERGLRQVAMWLKELEDSFPYVETEDQIRVLKEIKRDMESERPMDRLLCGDVGYGKTEVALRAAFKAVMDGKQVATSILTSNRGSFPS